MTQPPKASIIVPVYNAEPYLEECIKSITAQTESDIEIIFVDDASTDNSLAILRDAMQDLRIKVYHLEENSGQAAARNKGLENAHGEWVYFCDADDIISSELVESCYEAAAQTDSDMVMFGFSVFGDEEEMLNRFAGDTAWPYEGEQDAITAARLSGLVGCQCTHFFKRALIEKYHLRFDDDNRKGGEDFGFIMSYVATIKKAYIINKYLYKWRIRKGSATSQMFDDISATVRNMENVIERAVNFWVLHKLHKTNKAVTELVLRNALVYQHNWNYLETEDVSFFRRRVLSKIGAESVPLNPLASIIMPITSAENLREQLDGIRRQSYSNYEVICVCSDDSPEAEIIVREEMKRDKRICIRTKHEQYGKSMFDIGTRAAMGDYWFWYPRQQTIFGDALRGAIRALGRGADPLQLQMNLVGAGIDITRRRPSVAPDD